MSAKKPPSRINLVLPENFADRMGAYEQALGNCPEVYQDHSGLIIVQESMIVEPDSNIKILQLQPANEYSIRAIIEKYYQFSSDQKKQLRLPKREDFKALVFQRNYESIRPLFGISELPIVRTDGSIFTVPGYDEKTGIIYHPSKPFPVFHENPTKDQAMQATAELWRLVREFCWAEPKGVCFSVFLSLLLTITARTAIRGCTPFFRISGNMPSVGKSKLALIVAYITTGDTPTKLQYSNNEEMRKKFTTYIMETKRLLFMDELPNIVGNKALQEFIVSTTWNDRLLSKNQSTGSLPNRTVIIGAGNNVSLTHEMNRRSIGINLESETPYASLQSDFTHSNIVGHVRDNWREYAAHVFTILAYHFSTPDEVQFPRTIASFEEWQAVQCAVMKLGLPDPAHGQGFLEIKGDNENEQIENLLSELFDFTEFIQGHWAGRDLIDSIANHQNEWDKLARLLKDLCGTPANKSPSVRSVGCQLAKISERTIGGFVLKKSSKPNNIQHWYVDILEENE